MRNFYKMVVIVALAILPTSSPVFAAATAASEAKIEHHQTLHDQTQYQSQPLTVKRSEPFIIKVDRTHSTKRTFHINEEVNNAGFVEYANPESTRSEYLQHEHVYLAKKLFALDGVCYVGFPGKRYQVSIDIGKAFDVKKVEKKAIKVIAEYFASSDPLVSDLNKKKVATQKQPNKKDCKKKSRR